MNVKVILFDDPPSINTSASREIVFINGWASIQTLEDTLVSVAGINVNDPDAMPNTTVHVSFSCLACNLTFDESKVSENAKVTQLGCSIVDLRRRFLI